MYEALSKKPSTRVTFIILTTEGPAGPDAWGSGGTGWAGSIGAGEGADLA